MMHLIALFTDFGFSGPYVAQMKAVFVDRSCDIDIVDLMHDAPRFNPKASAYLLAAVVKYMPHNMITVAVVDPGVGSARKAIVLYSDGRWFVGPDNGLLEVVAIQSIQSQWYEIKCNDLNISASFHGRDLFSPVALKLFNQEPKESFLALIEDKKVRTTPDLMEIIYIDGFGNLMTGVRASMLSDLDGVIFKNQVLPRYCTFSDAPLSAAFVFENSQGLLEIAVNSGSAKSMFNAKIGDEIVIKHQKF